MEEEEEGNSWKKERKGFCITPNWIYESVVKSPIIVGFSL
jgi:hypothetical protein